MNILTTVVVPIVGIVIAGFVGWLTARASARGTVAAAQVTSLADLEREAGTRAASIYQHAIGRLETELGEARDEITQLERRQVDQDRQLGECRRACRQLARRTGEPEPDFT